MKLLIIEDERQLSDSIVSYLGREDNLCELLPLSLIENQQRIVSKNAIAEHLNGDMADMLNDFHGWSVAYRFANGHHQFIVTFNNNQIQ